MNHRIRIDAPGPDHALVRICGNLKAAQAVFRQACRALLDGLDGRDLEAKEAARQLIAVKLAALSHSFTESTVNMDWSDDQRIAATDLLGAAAGRMGIVEKALRAKPTQRDRPATFDDVAGVLAREQR